MIRVVGLDLRRGEEQCICKRCGRWYLRSQETIHRDRRVCGRCLKPRREANA